MIDLSNAFQILLHSYTFPFKTFLPPIFYRLRIIQPTIMKVVSITGISTVLTVWACFLGITNAIDPDELYSSAMIEAKNLPTTPYPTSFSQSQIDHLLYIPQYDPIKGEYEGEHHIESSKLPSIQSNIISPLKKAAEMNHVESLLALADFHLFGNYSIPTNYTKAEQYYQRVVSITGNGHAYFMLGFIHALGLFGTFPQDQGRALMYYQFAAENGHIGANMALGYRYAQGRSVNKSCEVALIYYQRVAEDIMSRIQHEKTELHEKIVQQITLEAETDLIDTLPKPSKKSLESLQNTQPVSVTYNVRLPDFTGGLFGKLTDTMTLYISREKTYDSQKQLNEQYNIDTYDHEFVNLYYDAMKYYRGDYFFPRNITKATELLTECARLGEKIYAGSSYQIANEIEAVILSHCHEYLGRIYLMGEAGEVNIRYALKQFELAVHIHRNGLALQELAFMVEAGYIPPETAKKWIKRGYNYDGTVLTTALSLYKRAHELGSNEALFSRVRLLEQMGPLSDDTKTNISIWMENAASAGSTTALYHMANNMQKRYTSDYECSTNLMYTTLFCGRNAHRVMPQLKFAFDSILRREYSNALVGYAIAAEMGSERAHVSAAYLLYQLQPLYESPLWLKLMGKTLRPKKTFSKERIQTAMKYLERASTLGNVDATILLGDMVSQINAHGISSLTGTEMDNQNQDVSDASNYSNDIPFPVSTSAFSYYQDAEAKGSSHGLYKLAQMYEYGYGPSSGTPDYYLAKRYYDLSILYRSLLTKDMLGVKFSISWALLRLRLKYIFWGGRGSDSWLLSFKRQSSSVPAEEPAHKPISRAQAHHEGTDYEDDDVWDTLSIFFNVAALSITLIGIFLLARRRRRNAGNNNNNQERNRNWWDFQFGLNNVEFHFFAI